MRTIDTIQLGDSASFTKTVTETDIVLYAGITGDLNPAHINAEAAKASMFGQRIAHGMLSAGFISCVLGMYLPVPSIWVRSLSSLSLYTLVIPLLLPLR